MKKALLLLFFFSLCKIFSQIAIGKSAVSNSFVSIEFGSEYRGLILPWVSNTSAVTGAVPGTLVYDTSTNKVKLAISDTSGSTTVSSWHDLTVESPDLSSNTTYQNALTNQNNLTENTTAKVSIGTTTSSTSGILELVDSDKAMILPVLSDPYLNIINPTAGTIAYNSSTNMLEIFDGVNWTFWK